jgi:hypothetical protein
MGKFFNDVKKFVENTKAKERMLHKRTVEHAYRSIRFGSAVTGAPGQPVDTTELLKSWRMVKRANRITDLVSNAPHADIIEHNRRGARLRSKVGGFHSVAITRMGWHLIVKYEWARVGNGGGDGVPSDAPTIASKRARNARGQFVRRKHAELLIHG